MSSVFISYKRDDMAAPDGSLKRLVTRLRRNFNIWLDKSDIIPGTNWEKSLQDAVSSSQALVFIVSPLSVMSEYCKIELNTALDKNIPVIPYVYQKCDLPARLRDTHAIFHDEPGAAEKLEAALRQHAPLANTQTASALITEKLLHDKSMTFTQAAQKTPSKEFFVSLKRSAGEGEKLSEEEIRLIGLPLLTTSYCSAYLVGREGDTLGYQNRLQLALQFAGTYEAASFPIEIARHFLQQDPAYPLRMILVRGPAQLTYDNSQRSNLVYNLDVPTPDENQWLDALNAVQMAVEVMHQNRLAPELQIFVQGPVAGITYELGSAHRGLHYKAEHYQYDRDKKQYYRVLGKIG